MDNKTTQVKGEEVIETSKPTEKAAHHSVGRPVEFINETKDGKSVPRKASIKEDLSGEAVSTKTKRDQRGAETRKRKRSAVRKLSINKDI